MSDPHPSPDRAEPLLPTPYPTAGHLYLLVAGILIGLALGPAVLGRLAPATYDAWFVGGGDDARRLVREEAALSQQLTLLGGVGVTDVAAEELVARETQRLAPLKARVQAAQAERDRAVRGWLAGIMATLILLAVAECLVAPPPRSGQPVEVPRALAGLVTARYGLLALWLALAVAKPSLILDLPWGMTVMLAAVAATAALVPLGRRRRAGSAVL